MDFGKELTYTEISNVLEKKYVDSSTTGYTLEPGNFETSDVNFL